MAERSIYEKIQNYRSRRVVGDNFELHPVEEKDLPVIVRLRNQNVNVKNMSLQIISLLDQEEWYQNYLKRRDDIYWVVADRDGKIHGTIRLDEITDEKAEIGSLAIEQTSEKKIQSFEAAVKLAAQVAFRELGIKKLWASVPVGDKFMHKLDARMGFVHIRSDRIRGNLYDILEIAAEDFFWKIDLYDMLKHEQYDLISEVTPRDGLREKQDWIADILFRWLGLMQRNVNVVNMMKDSRMNSAAIYGMAVLGEQMMDEIQKSDVELVYVIDRYVRNYKGIPSYMPDDALPQVDAIIITCMDCDNVKEMLKMKTSAELIHISELIERNENVYGKERNNERKV